MTTPPAGAPASAEGQLLLPLFTGEETRVLDSKSRLTLPLRWRDEFPGRAILTRSLEGHLILTRPATWERWVAAAREPSWLGFHLSGAWELPIQPFRGGPGMETRKILVPAAAREWAGLQPGADAVLAGCGDGIVIAAPDRWQATLSAWRAEQVARRAQRGAGVTR